MIFDLIFITIITSIGIHSGFFDSIEDWLSKRLFNGRIKVELPTPFHCEFCASWWMMLLYLVITSNLTLHNIMIAIVFAYFAELIPMILDLLKDVVTSVINILYKLIQK